MLGLTSSFPSTLPPDILSKFPKLSSPQAGHLRHFHNLAAQPDGEWRHMGSQDPGQEWLDSYRYQLATMAYAAGAAHYHRMPALRSVFKTLMEQLIHKMLRREVWGYWYLTSQSGKFVDPDIKELRKPWPDPVTRENIMYSGHLLLMVSLHAMLFDDDKYDAPGALTFHWNPIFWGMGPESFPYSRSTLQDAILAEMERTSWMGVCCEPNSVFIVCNQFPLIAMRYNDVRTGSNVVGPVLEKYMAAWASRNGFAQGEEADGGLMVNWWSPKQDRFVRLQAFGMTAWACAFMNAWNSRYVHTMSPVSARGFLSPAPDGRLNVNSTTLASEIRRLVKEEGADPDSAETLQTARAGVAAAAEKRKENGKETPAPPSAPEFGYAAKWASEVAGPQTLNGLLKHADAFMGPSWENGGLYYPRRDGPPTDDEGNWVFTDPFTGNAAIGYARLNVPDGQRKMWEEPWGKERFEREPWVEGVGLGSGVDFLRGAWDEDLSALVVTMKSWDGSEKK